MELPMTDEHIVFHSTTTKLVKNLNSNVKSVTGIYTIKNKNSYLTVLKKLT